jgi:hypothetical protein
MQRCAAFNIDVPDSFPLSAWEGFYSVGFAATAFAAEAQPEFIRAVGCITYRYKTCDEAVSSMISDWRRNGGSLTMEGRYTLQRDLFSFFTCGLSAVESLFYAIYVVATLRHPGVLNWSDHGARRTAPDPRKISPTLRRGYSSGHPVITEIDKLLAAQEWNDWNAFRNTMIHRSLQSRAITGSIVPMPPDEMVKYAESWSNPALVADEAGMQGKLVWLADHLKSILDAARGM